MAQAEERVRRARIEVEEAKIEVAMAKARVACCEKSLATANKAAGDAVRAVDWAEQAYNAAEQALEYGRIALREAKHAEADAAREMEAAGAMDAAVRQGQESTQQGSARLRVAGDNEESGQRYAVEGRLELDRRIERLLQFNLEALR